MPHPPSVHNLNTSSPNNDTLRGVSGNFRRWPLATWRNGFLGVYIPACFLSCSVSWPAMLARVHDGLNTLKPWAKTKHPSLNFFDIGVWSPWWEKNKLMQQNSVVLESVLYYSHCMWRSEFSTWHPATVSCSEKKAEIFTSPASWSLWPVLLIICLHGPVKSIPSLHVDYGATLMVTTPWLLWSV